MPQIKSLWAIDQRNTMNSVVSRFFQDRLIQLSSPFVKEIMGRCANPGRFSWQQVCVEAARTRSSQRIAIRFEQKVLCTLQRLCRHSIRQEAYISWGKCFSIYWFPYVSIVTTSPESWNRGSFWQLCWCNKNLQWPWSYRLGLGSSCSLRRLVNCHPAPENVWCWKWQIPRKVVERSRRPLQWQEKMDECAIIL